MVPYTGLQDAWVASVVAYLLVCVRCVVEEEAYAPTEAEAQKDARSVRRDSAWVLLCFAAVVACRGAECCSGSVRRAIHSGSVLVVLSFLLFVFLNCALTWVVNVRLRVCVAPSKCSEDHLFVSHFVMKW